MSFKIWYSSTKNADNNSFCYYIYLWNSSMNANICIIPYIGSMHFHSDNDLKMLNANTEFNNVIKAHNLRLNWSHMPIPAKMRFKPIVCSAIVWYILFHVTACSLIKIV